MDLQQRDGRPPHQVALAILLLATFAGCGSAPVEGPHAPPAWPVDNGPKKPHTAAIDKDLLTSATDTDAASIAAGAPSTGDTDAKPSTGDTDAAPSTGDTDAKPSTGAKPKSP